MNTDQFFELAKVVDNEYIGKRQCFTAKPFAFPDKTGFYLSTNLCDYASFIRVFLNQDQKLIAVQVCGDYTDGRQNVTEPTLNRIFDKFPNLKNDS